MKNVLMAIALVCVGIGMTIWGMGSVAKAKASTDWPTVEGVITVSRVDVERRTTTRNGRNTTKTSYEARVRYEYTVNGASYSGDRIVFGGNDSSSVRSTAQETADRYAVGTRVQVTYNPDDPSDAVLEPGVTWSTYAVSAVGVVLIVSGILSPFIAAFRGR